MKWIKCLIECFKIRRKIRRMPMDEFEEMLKECGIEEYNIKE